MTSARRSPWTATTPDKMSAFDLSLLERDELFNTRVSGYIAWAQAVRKLIPTPRGAARIDVTQIVLDSGAATTGEAVDALLGRFLRIPVSSRHCADALVALLDDELGTSDLSPRPDLYGRSAAHGDPPHHEHPGVSGELSATALCYDLLR